VILEHARHAANPWNNPHRSWQSVICNKELKEESQTDTHSVLLHLADTADAYMVITE